MRKLKPFEVEIVKRSMNHEGGINLKYTVEWVMNTELTQVTTETAFQLARGGREVFMYYLDGTDSLLDDIDFEAGYYLAPECLDENGKPKTYPEIETIFIVEGEL